MPNVTVDDIRVDDGNGDPTSILDATATAARVRLVDAAGNAVNPADPASTIADGADVALGATTDDAVTTNVAGTVSGKLRGLVAIFADVWNSTLQALKVELLPSAVSANGLSNATTIAYAASLVAKAAAGRFYGVSGYNSSAATQFIQIHDSAALPANGAFPKIVFSVPALTAFSFAPPSAYGRVFTDGIVVCNSSTGPTKTVGSADCWFDVQFK